MLIKSINIVCFANYCRSPVAEVLMSDKFEGLNITSSGIQPLIKSTMSKRSLKFLLKNGYDHKVHIPKKVNSEIIKNFDITLAMDVEVLMYLNDQFPNQKSRIKLFNYQQPSYSIPDPYQFNEKDYFDVMKKIKFVVDNFSIK